MSFTSIEYTIPAWAVSAIEYPTEYVGEEGDLEAVEAFLKREGLNGLTVWEYGEETFFSPRNDITGWQGNDCITAVANVPNV